MLWKMTCPLIQITLNVLTQNIKEFDKKANF